MQDKLLHWWCHVYRMNDPICYGSLFYGDTVQGLYHTILYIFCKYNTDELCSNHSSTVDELNRF